MSNAQVWVLIEMKQPNRKDPKLKVIGFSIKQHGMQSMSVLVIVEQFISDYLVSLCWYEELLTDVISCAIT